jgi:hypothetical protein
VRIGDFADIAIEDFGAQGMDAQITLTNIPHPANTSLAISRASRGRVEAFGLEIDNAGKNGRSTPFARSG